MNVTELKALLKDAVRIENFHKDYPRTLEEYQTLHPDTMVDKYKYGFNADHRFPICYNMSLSFDALIGHYGGGGCACMMPLGLSSGVLFQELLTDYLNENQEEIFAYISKRMRAKAFAELETIKAERDGLNKIISFLESGEPEYKEEDENENTDEDDGGGEGA